MEVNVLKSEENKHHIIPRSRRHNSRKTVGLPKGFHTGLHIVFGNLYGEEMIEFIKELNRLMEVKYFISGKELEELREQIKERLK